MNNEFDVIVMGGGPAGTACGNFLARAGVRVVVLEGERHPRHHIGESLLAASMPILERLGVSMGEMQARYQPKFGARFYDPVRERMEVFEFEVPEGSPKGWSPSFQVVREEFDGMLAGKAREAGCVVMEGAVVEAFEENGERPWVRLKDGAEMGCRVLVDATGREPLIAMKRRGRGVIGEYGRVGIYNYFVELPAHDEADAKYITMYLLEGGGGGWVWLIPLKDGRTSVGVVYRDVPPVEVRDGQTKAEALFWAGVEKMPRLAGRLRSARATESYRAIGDYSFTVSEKCGESWVAVGDAAGFLDPIFSSGVHLALASAEKASAGILEKLRTGSVAGLREYAAYMDQGYQAFRAFVHRFYNRDLVGNLFFMDNKPAGMHGAITRILAGNVWEEGNPVLRMIVGENSKPKTQTPKPFEQVVALEGA